MLNRKAYGPSTTIPRTLRFSPQHLWCKFCAQPKPAVTRPTVWVTEVTYSVYLTFGNCPAYDLPESGIPRAPVQTITHSRRCTMRSVYPWLTAAAILTAAVLVGCGVTNSAPTSGRATVNVVLSDPATCEAPNGPFSQVWVTITDVKASTNANAGDNDSSFVDLTPGLSAKPQQVNLSASRTTSASSPALARPRNSRPAATSRFACSSPRTPRPLPTISARTA